MSDRTALIISCSQEEAARIHQRAALERRTVSGYVLRILMRWLDLEERLAKQQEQPLTAYHAVRPSGARTTILIRCSNAEAHRIRAGAKGRCATISWFVIQTLVLSWSAADRVLKETPQKK